MWTVSAHMCRKSLLRMVGADSDIPLTKHHQLMMKYAAQPSSSIIASSGDTYRSCD